MYVLHKYLQNEQLSEWQWHPEGSQATKLAAAVQLATNHLIYVSGSSSILRKKLGGRTVRTSLLTMDDEKDSIKVDPDSSMDLWAESQGNRIYSELSLFAGALRMICHICV